MFTIFIRRIATCNFVRKIKSAINGKSHNILCISNIVFDLSVISTMVTTVSYLYDLSTWILVFVIWRKNKSTWKILLLNASLIRNKGLKNYLSYLMFLRSWIGNQLILWATKIHLIIIHFLWKYFRLVYCFLCTLLS